MTVCGVSQLFSTEPNECPLECPFWAPSSVWKYIGVCSKSTKCNLYNPTLRYADVKNSVCLPCNVFGCIVCKYSDIHDSITPITDPNKKLPDYCLQCAKGYIRSEDGHMCYLVDGNIWSKLLMYLVILVLVSIALLVIRLLMDRGKMKKNFNTLLFALKNQQKKMLRLTESSGRSLYNLYIDIRKNNISGIGLMLYFRATIFLTLVMSLLFFCSLSHVHIPCSDMIRIFKEPFRIYYFMRSDDERTNFIANFFSKNVNKLVDDIFNFKSVDEAINWNVVQYSKEVSNVMNVLYISIMLMTLVYLVSQKRVINSFTSNTTKLKELTLILKNLPKSLTNEDEIADMLYTASSITPSSVSLCYDLKLYKEYIDYFVEGIEEMKIQSDGYVNFNRIEEFNRCFTRIESSGECFVTFENLADRKMFIKNFNKDDITISRCDVEPENVLWENVGHERNINSKIVLISIITIGCLTLYSVLFFVPYAIYSISSQMKHLMEIMLVSLFLDCGNMIVSFILRNLITRAGIINSDVVEGYLMFCSYFIKILNMSLNIILSHIINYGGMSKLISLFDDKSTLDSASFRIGEELSFGVSFSIYMVNVLIVIPNGFFLFQHYILPVFNSFLVLTMDFDEQRASKLMEFSKFDLSHNYTDNLAHMTCCLFLLFLIRDRKQACVVFVTMCISYLLNYIKSQYIVLRRSSKKYYSTWRLAYFTFIIWAFPTMILAMCPQYWRWRAGLTTFKTVLLSGCLHLVVYLFIVFYLFHPHNNPISNISFNELLQDKTNNKIDYDLEYKFYNPLYRLKMLTKEYNVL